MGVCELCFAVPFAFKTRSERERTMIDYFLFQAQTSHMVIESFKARMVTGSEPAVPAMLYKALSALLQRDQKEIIYKGVTLHVRRRVITLPAGVTTAKFMAKLKRWRDNAKRPFDSSAESVRALMQIMYPNVASTSTEVLPGSQEEAMPVSQLVQKLVSYGKANGRDPLKPEGKIVPPYTQSSVLLPVMRQLIKVDFPRRKVDMNEFKKRLGAQILGDGLHYIPWFPKDSTVRVASYKVMRMIGKDETPPLVVNADPRPSTPLEQSVASTIAAHPQASWAISQVQMKDIGSLDRRAVWPSETLKILNEWARHSDAVIAETAAFVRDNGFSYPKLVHLAFVVTVVMIRMLPATHVDKDGTLAIAEKYNLVNSTYLDRHEMERLVFPRGEWTEKARKGFTAEGGKFEGVFPLFMMGWLIPGTPLVQKENRETGLKKWNDVMSEWRAIRAHMHTQS